MIGEKIAAPSRALVVSLDQMGDLVFASALVAPLLERFPGVAVDVWCREPFSDVARLIPGVRDVFTIDPFWIPTFRGGGHRTRGTLAESVAGVMAVRAARHDIAILAAAPWRTAAAVALTRIPVRIGHARRRNAMFLTHVVEAADRGRPVVAEEARLLAPLGIDAALVTRLDPAPLADRIVRIRHGATAPIVALHPFANDPARCVALSEWVAVASHLVARGNRILWVGATHELDAVRATAAPAEWLFSDVVGDGSLRDVAACLAAASAFIGHDSGPLHVANALGVPSVGVFAPGEPARTFPQGPGPWRLVARDRPTHIAAADILSALDALPSPLASRQ